MVLKLLETTGLQSRRQLDDVLWKCVCIMENDKLRWLPLVVNNRIELVLCVTHQWFLEVWTALVEEPGKNAAQEGVLPALGVGQRVETGNIERRGEVRTLSITATCPNTSTH